MKAILAAMSKFSFFNIVFCNKATFVDNHCWMNIYAYDWVQVPSLLTMQHVVDGGGANNPMSVIVGVAMGLGGLTIETLVGMCIVGVTTQLFEMFTP